MRRLRYIPPLIAAMLIVACSSVARAELFVIDPGQSSLTMALTIGSAFTGQAAEAVITSYFGTIDATLGDPLSAGTSIAFNAPGTTISANNSGSWAPDTAGDVGNPAPANYGFQGTYVIYPALVTTRDIAFTLSGGAVDPTFDFKAGTSDADVTIGNQLGKEFVGNTNTSIANTGTATYIPNGDGSGTLTIPISVTFMQPDDNVPTGSVFTFTGTLVAVSAVPEPSGGLLSCMALGLIACRRRHRKVA